MVGEVAIPLLVELIAAGDVVDADPAASGQLVERGKLPRHQGRRHESGPVRDQHLEGRRGVENVGGDREPVRAGGAVADEHPVKARLFMGLREPAQVAGVDLRAVKGAARFRDLLGPHHADNLDGHC
jgi:hypothetical protein